MFFSSNITFLVKQIFPETLIASGTELSMVMFIAPKKYLKTIRKKADKKSQTRLFEEINKEPFLSKENNDTDSTGNILYFLSQISYSVNEEVDKRLSGEKDLSRHCQKYSDCCSPQESKQPKKLNE